MAKLSARGRMQLLRMERTRAITEFYDYPEGVKISRSVARSYDVIEEREKYALMSDIHLLYKLDCTWQDGQKHSYPWKDMGKTTLTVAQISKRLTTKGFTFCER